MDKTLADLFTAWWVSRTQDAARFLADGLQERDRDQIAAVLLRFRSVNTPWPAVFTAPRLSVERRGPAYQEIARALQEIARALTAAVPEEPPEQQGEGF